MTVVAIEVPGNDESEMTKVFEDNNIEFQSVRSNGFDATSTITLIVELSPIAAGLVAGLYGIRKKAQKHIVLKHKGIEVRGVSEETLLKLVQNSEKEAEKKGK